MATITTGYKYNTAVQLEVTQESQNIANNYSTVKWILRTVGTSGWSATVSRVTATVNGQNVVNNKLYGYSIKVGTILDSGTMNVYHNSNGKKSIPFSLNARVGGTDYSRSSNLTLSTIPRQARITNAPNFNDEQNPTISYSNPAGNSVTSLQACIGWTGHPDIPYRDISKTGTSYTFNLTTAERDKIRNVMRTRKSMNLRFYVKTVIGGNTYLSSLERTVSIINANPVLGTLSYKDTNADMINITGNNQWLVQNRSNLQITVTNGTKARKGATISWIQIYINGKWKRDFKPITDGQTINLNYGKFEFGSDTTVNVRVIDSRNNYTNKYIKVKAYQYYGVQANITIQRENNVEPRTTISGSGAFASINGKNTVSQVMIKYKEKTATNWSNWINVGFSINNNKVTITDTILILDRDKEYDVQINFVDKFGWNMTNYLVNKGIFLFEINTEKEKCFVKDKEIATLNAIYPVGSIYISVNNVNPSTYFGGTWVSFGAGRTLVGVDTGQAEFNSVQKTGGAKTHTLTQDEMPSHRHRLYGAYSDYSGTSNWATYSQGSPSSRGTSTPGWMRENVIYPTGGGQAHNNLQPYITVYMWRRTA